MVVQQVKRSGRRVSSGGDGNEMDLQELREEDFKGEEEFQLSFTSICCYFWKHFLVYGGTKETVNKRDRTFV